mmetsp:Transcript_22244/g.34427  ORF Transcript_22244/g.34427 Transcript_22244/m.34427 type:complete len:121 (+) Transcript_22244:402-764(+)
MAQMALKQIFDFQDSSADNERLTVSMSFFNVKKDNVHDLLSSDSLPPTLKIREDQKGISVLGLSSIPLTSIKDFEIALSRNLEKTKGSFSILKLIVERRKFQKEKDASFKTGELYDSELR